MGRFTGLDPDPVGSQHPALGPVPSQRLKPEVLGMGGAGALPCLGSILALCHTPRGQPRARLTHFQHPGLTQLGAACAWAGVGRVPCGDIGVAGEQRSEAVRGALWRGVLLWDGRRLASEAVRIEGRWSLVTEESLALQHLVLLLCGLADDLGRKRSPVQPGAGWRMEPQPWVIPHPSTAGP